MTLGEAKKQLMRITDETKPKADYTEKLNTFFDEGQKEIAIYYPLWREQTYTTADAKTLPVDCFKPCYVIVNGVYYLYKKYEALPDEFTLRYKATPATIEDTTSDTYELETQPEAQLALIYFVAAQCQTMEYDQRYYNTFFAQYQGKLNNLPQSYPVACVGVANAIY